MNSVGQLTPVSEVISQFRPPETPQELLLNIKSAINFGLLLREDFYAEKNLQKVIGKYTYNWQDNERTHKYIRFELPPALLGEMSGCISEGVISWRGDQADSGNTEQAVFNASLNEADSHCHEFSADLIKSIFGNPVKVTDIFGGTMPPPHGRNVEFGPKTHPLGHTDIEFNVAGAGSAGTLSFEIRGDGVARSFKLRIHRNK